MSKLEAIIEFLITGIFLTTVFNIMFHNAKNEESKWKSENHKD